MVTSPSLRKTDIIHGPPRYKDDIERAVGAALRGRPCVEFSRRNTSAGAATEGPPYSTFGRTLCR